MKLWMWRTPFYKKFFNLHRWKSLQQGGLMSAVSFFILIFPYLNIFNRTILDFGSTFPFSTVLLYSNFSCVFCFCNTSIASMRNLPGIKLANIIEWNLSADERCKELKYFFIFICTISCYILYKPICF